MKSDLRTLVTSGRFPPATAVVRGLHSIGAHVDAADPYRLSPALHSSAVEQLHEVASTVHETARFLQDIGDIVRQRQIDLIVPAFEEGFYLAKYAALLPAPVFAPDFKAIERLHSKSRFLELCRELGLRTPKTIMASSRDELRSAIAQFQTYVARPAYSRAGMTCLTNHGPRAGESSVEACQPTATNPWLVQEFVEGHDACSTSIARNGRILVHCNYEPTLASDGGWSIQFASVADTGSFDIASRICSELNITGFVGFDYRRTDDGIVMIECNPRSSAGLFLTPETWIGEAVLGDPSDLTETRFVEPGIRRQYDAYVLNQKVSHLSAREVVRTLLTTPEALMTPHDVLPAFFFFLSRRHWSAVAKREHTDYGDAYFGDIAWDGTPLPDVPAGAVTANDLTAWDGSSADGVRQ